MRRDESIGFTKLDQLVRNGKMPKSKQKKKKKKKKKEKKIQLNLSNSNVIC